MLSSPAVVDGLVYVAAGNTVSCLDATTGAQVWSYMTDGEVNSSPAVANGVVYIGSDGDKIYAFGGVHDVAVTDIALSKTMVYQGFSADINVTVANQGDYTETFNVAAYANATIIGSENVTLPANNSMTVTFTWNTTGFAVGNYTIEVETLLTPGEINVASNVLVDGTLRINLMGDVNGDGKVDMSDIMTIVNAFGSYPGHPRWNPDCDLNHDGRIDLADVVLALMNFGKTS